MPYKDPAMAKARLARWREDHPRYARDRNLRLNYGMTIEEYDRLVMLQCGACAICGRVPCEDPDAAAYVSVGG